MFFKCHKSVPVDEELATFNAVGTFSSWKGPCFCNSRVHWFFRCRFPEFSINQHSEHVSRKKWTIWSSLHQGGLWTKSYLLKICSLTLRNLDTAELIAEPTVVYNCEWPIDAIVLFHFVLSCACTVTWYHEKYMFSVMTQNLTWFAS